MTRFVNNGSSFEINHLRIVEVSNIEVSFEIPNSQITFQILRNRLKS